MVVSTAEFKKGMKIQFDGAPYTIVDFQHVKPGKGGAFVRTKLKHMKLGRVIDNTFRAGEKVELVDFEEKRMQYLYKDDRYNFMDLDTYDQISLSAEEVGDARDFLKENTEVEILFIDASPVTVELAELHRAADRQDGSRHPRRHRLRRLQARHPRDRGGGSGAALPQRGRRREGRYAQRRVSRPRVGGGLAWPGGDRPAAPRIPRASASTRWSSWRWAQPGRARGGGRGYRIRIVREHAPGAAVPRVESAAAIAAPLQQPAPETVEFTAHLLTVEAPMVGTFYRACARRPPRAMSKWSRRGRSSASSRR